MSIWRQQKALAVGGNSKTTLKYWIIYFAGLILTTSCGQSDNETANTILADSNTIKKTQVDNVSTPTETSQKKGIRKYISDEYYFHWKTLHADTTQYLCELTFHKHYAIYWYHGQCQYFYFTYLTSDTTIELLWSYKMDCILNMDFLDKSNGVKKFPRSGDVFAKYTLINDSTLHVKYYFPDWAKKINEIERDSIFPSKFYLAKSL